MYVVSARTALAIIITSRYCNEYDPNVGLNAAASLPSMEISPLLLAKTINN
jgi:hypothetical protein